MMTPSLQSIHLRNFKAIQDSGPISLTPLTVLIGNNGSGKSSVVEGLETLQAVVEVGLDRAMQRWLGFEFIVNQARTRRNWQSRADRRYPNPLYFGLRGRIEGSSFTADMDINVDVQTDEVFIQREQVVVRKRSRLERDAQGETNISRLDQLADVIRVPVGESVLDRELDGFIGQWQFLSLVPRNMGAPAPRQRTGGPVRLATDGSNVAEYLLSIRTLNPTAFEGVIEALQAVLPYATDLQPVVTSELERTVYLQLTEGSYKVPGWLLSTGTLRVLALLAVLRHPTPPPLIVIEEIENGLDPRTVGMIVEELRAAVQSGTTQVIMTTHSPYLLDLLALEQIVLVERVDGQPTFTRPADQESLRGWAERFSPGQLYTMGRLSPGAGA